MRKVAGLLLGGGLIGGAFLIAELWHRNIESDVRLIFDQPGRGFSTQPGTHGTNLEGFYEADLPAGRNAAVQRVVVLGDSVTWGLGAKEEAWPHVMEQNLNQILPGKPFQVLNFSHYGYDVAAVRAVWEHVAVRYRPDWVIYGMYTNDVVPNSVIYIGDSSYPIWIGQTPVLPGWLHTNSALLRRLEGAYMVRGITEKPDWDWFERELRMLATSVEQAGVRFGVVALPPHVLAGAVCEGESGWCERQGAIVARQQEIAAGLGVPVLSGLDVWNLSGEEAFYGPNRQDLDHPSVEGARLMGEGAARWLSEQLSLNQ